MEAGKLGVLWRQGRKDRKGGRQHPLVYASPSRRRRLSPLLSDEGCGVKYRDFCPLLFFYPTTTPRSPFLPPSLALQLMIALLAPSSLGLLSSVHRPEKKTKTFFLFQH